MNISNVYGKSEGGYLPLCASLYWQPIYIPLNIGHLSAVTTAIPWLLKQDCKKFYVWGELYMSLSKSDGRGDVYIWRMREGQSRCTPGILWRYEGISILGLSGLNRTHSLEETSWKGERFQSDQVCYSSSTLKTTNHLALQQATSLWEKKKKDHFPPKYLFFTMFLRLIFFKSWQVRPGPRWDHCAELPKAPHKPQQTKGPQDVSAHERMGPKFRYPQILLLPWPRNHHSETSRKGNELNGGISPSKNGLSTLFACICPPSAGWLGALQFAFRNQ